MIPMKGITDDGVGDYIVPKGLFALLTVIVMLVSCVATVAAMGATMQSDINNLQSMCDDVDDLDTRLNAYEKHTEVTMSQMIDMKEDLRVIRRDVQELLKK